MVGTSHPGNIGATARAMKTMGLSDLALVSPREFPSAEARARASGADDVLDGATLYETLEDAVASCGFVVGASARQRSVPCPVVDPRECAAEVWRKLERNEVAVVMGPEQSGLTNEDLAVCQRLVSIPTDAHYGSLNVAMAAQIICYELRMVGIGHRAAAHETREAPLATAGELAGFHKHLEQALEKAGFFDPHHPRRLKLKLRRVFQRAELDRNEINILRGVLSALDPDRPRHEDDGP
jgi:tRNA (cytidine32/uridine32-2'-O)-methyltransferase